MTDEEIRYWSRKREEAIANGMPEDLSAMSPAPAASAVSAVIAGLKAGNTQGPDISKLDAHRAREMADLEIAKSYMRQLEARRQQEAEKQLKDKLEEVKREITQRRVDRAQRQFQMAKDVYQKGGDAGQLSDRFRLDLLGELGDSFWNSSDKNNDTGFWGYSADDLAGMKKEEDARRQVQQWSDTAEKMRPASADDSSIWGYSADDLARMKAAENFRKQAQEWNYRIRKTQPAKAGDLGVWGYSADDLARMKRAQEEEAAARYKSNWNRQYNDVADKLQNAWADTPKFTPQQVDAAAEGMRRGYEPASTGADTGLTDEREAEIRAAYLRKLGGQPYTTDGQYEQYFSDLPLMKKILGPGFTTDFWGMTADQLGAMKKSEGDAAARYKSDWDRQYNDVAAKMQSTLADAPTFTPQQINAASEGMRQGYEPASTGDTGLTDEKKAEIRAAYLRKLGGQSYATDGQYDQYFSNLHLMQQILGKGFTTDFWGMTTDQLGAMKKAQEGAAARYKSDWDRQYNDVAEQMVPKIDYTVPAEELNDVNAKLQPPEIGTGEVKQTAYNSEAYSQREDEVLNPSETLDKYQYLLQQLKDDPNMDLTKRSLLMLQLQKGYEKLAGYVAQYGRGDGDPSITNALANKAQDVADELSEVLHQYYEDEKSPIPEDQLSDEMKRDIRAAYLRRVSGQSYPTDGQFDNYLNNQHLMQQILGKGFTTDFWGMTTDQWGAAKKAEQDKAWDDLVKQKEQYNQTMDNLLTRFDYSPSAEELNNVNANLQPPEVSTGKSGDGDHIGKEYIHTPDKDLGYIQILQKYRYLALAYIEDPDFAEVNPDLFDELKQQGIEELGKIMQLQGYDPDVTRDIVNEADEITGYLSNSSWLNAVRMGFLDAMFSGYGMEITTLTGSDEEKERQRKLAERETGKSPMGYVLGQFAGKIVKKLILRKITGGLELPERATELVGTASDIADNFMKSAKEANGDLPTLLLKFAEKMLSSAVTSLGISAVGKAYGSQFIDEASKTKEFTDTMKAALGAAKFLIDNAGKIIVPSKDGDPFVKPTGNSSDKLGPKETFQNVAEMDKQGIVTSSEFYDGVTRSIDRWGNPVGGSTDIKTGKPLLGGQPDTSNLDRQLDLIYKKTGDSGVLMQTAPRLFTEDGQSYLLTPGERYSWQKNAGSYAAKQLNSLLYDDELGYFTMTFEERAKEVKGIMERANEIAKEEFLKSREEPLNYLR